MIKLSFKKITLYIFALILIIVGPLFLLSKNINEFNNHLSLKTNSHTPQYIDLENVDSDNPLDVGILTSILLSDENVFLGGESGKWAIENIVDGKVGETSTGVIEGHGDIQFIVKQFDYETSAKIILGFNMGDIVIFDTKEQTLVKEKKQLNTKSNDEKIVNILYTGEEDTYIVFGENGTVQQVNTSTFVFEDKTSIDIEDGCTIKSMIRLTSGEILLGDDNGNAYKYNITSGITTEPFSSSIENADKGSILTITRVDSDFIFFFGLDDGHWESVNLVSPIKNRIISQGDWLEGETTSINSSIKLNDENNTEILAAGDNGHWSVIDVYRNLKEPIIQDGNISSGNKINSILDLSDGDLSMVLFPCGNGEWTTFRFTGDIAGFDKDFKPESISHFGNEIDYKISTKSDYSRWPLYVKKYKVKSTLYDERQGKDISLVSETFDTFGEETIELHSLYYSTTYSDLRVQLLEEDGVTTIGEEWDTGVDFKTDIGRVSDILKATVNEINSDSFSFTIDTFDCSESVPDKVSPFTIDAFATIDEESEETKIWTSLLQSTAIDGTKFIVNGLNPGVKYNNVSIQLHYEDVGYIGTKFSLSNLITTKNIPLSLTGSFSEKTSDGFKILANIDAEDSSKKITDGYYMHATNDDDLDFTSEKKYEAGDDVEFIISGLNPGETYNIKIWLSWNAEDKNPIPNCETNIGKSTVENHAKEIKSASIDSKGITSKTFTIDSEIQTDNDSLNTTSPFTIKVYNVSEKGSDLLYETIPLFRGGELKPIIVPNLSMETSYNIKIQLLEDGMEIGSLFDLGEVTTRSSLVTGMSEISILSNTITSSSFDVQLNIDSEDSSKNVESYELRFFVNGETNTPIWKEKSTTAGIGLIFTIDGLQSSTTYTNTMYELWDTTNDKKIDYKLGRDITTLGQVTKFNGEPSVKHIKDKSFIMSLNIDDTFVEDSQNKVPHFVENYWIWIFANNDDSNPIWKSKNAYNISGQTTFTVDGLDTRTNFANIKVQFVDEEGTSFSGAPQETNISLKTKMNHSLEEGIIIGSIIFFVVAFFSTFITINIVKKSRQEKRDNFSQHIKFL